MTDKEEKEFSFEFKCADFQIGFKGDLNFVQNELRKYEPRILVKFHQIIPSEKPLAAPAPQPHQPQPQRQPQAQPQKQGQPQPQRQPQAQPQKQGQPQPAKPQPQPHRDDRRGFRGGRGGYKQTPEPYKQEDKKPTREPNFVENRGVSEERSRPEPESAQTTIAANELRSLLERYQPRTSHDRVMILAFYLEEKSAGGFNPADIQECYQALGERTPGNLSVILNNASRSGFLAKEEKAGRARYRLTFKGKRYVENGLRLD